MALTERTENDKIEVVGKYKTVQVRQATIIEKDGVEVARTFHRRSLEPGTLNDSDALVDTDLSGEDADVAGVATAVWTDAVKEAYRLMLVATK